MAEQEPGKFKLGMDEDIEELEPTPAGAEPSEPVDRKRFSAGFYIILALLVVGIVAAYFDLYRRVTRSQSIGSNQIDSLESRMVSLSDEINALKEQFVKKIADDQEAITGLKEQLSQVQKTMKKTVAAKADQAELNTTVAVIKKEIKQVGTETGKALEQLDKVTASLDAVNKMNTGLETLETKLTETREALSAEIEEITLQLDRSSKNLIKLKSTTDRLAAAKIDKQAADALIKKRLKSQPSPSEQRAEMNVLKQQIVDLRKNATIYENEILKMKRQLKSLASETSTNRSQTTPPSGKGASSSAVSTKPGDLQQQTLQE